MTFDWKQCYTERRTPWDLGEAHPELVARLATEWNGRSGRAYVPGCGRGHDALALARAGWTVTAVDFVDVPDGPRSELGAYGGEFVVANALTHRPPGASFDLVLEHTFFCALELRDRFAWGRMVDAVLAPWGRVWIIVWPADKPIEKGGPPFGFGVEDVTTALGPKFRLVRDESETRPVSARTWKGRWIEFARRDA